MRTAPRKLGRPPLMAKEAAVVTKILKALRERGAFAERIHGSRFQPRLIDVIACYRGRFIGLEVKLPGGKATERQQYTLDQIAKAGGIVATVHSVTELNAVLARVERPTPPPEVQDALDGLLDAIADIRAEMGET